MKLSWGSPKDRDLSNLDRLMHASSTPDFEVSLENQAEMFVPGDPVVPSSVEDSEYFDEGLDLTGMWENSGSRTADLQDLSWLDSPETFESFGDSNNIVPELEEAWMKNQKLATGLVPNRGQFRPAKDESQVLSKRQIADAVRHASRRSHFGDALDEIGRELASYLGKYAGVAEGAWKKIQQEHGLAGRVFIRASVFPGLQNGKWVPELKKRAGGARYVISQDLALGAKLGKEVVSTVPWEKALKHYAPKLAALGVKVASGNPKRSLQAAFLTPVVQTVATTPKPVAKAPSVNSTRQAAMKRTQANSVADAEAISLAKERNLFAGKLAKLAKAGLITEKQLKGFLSADDLRLAYAKAQEAANAVKVSAYQGVGIQKKQVLPSEKEASQALRKLASLKVDANVRRLMTQGVAGKALDAILSASDLKFPKRLASARKEHEGLSGFLYVDAGAYANELGWDCDEGALVHRGSEVPFVKKASACTACPFSRNGSCTKYDKPFLSKLPKNAEALREKVLKQAAKVPKKKASDYRNPVAEFGLRDDSMDRIDLSVNSEQFDVEFTEDYRPEPIRG